MAKRARTPEWVKTTPQFLQAKETMEAAQHAAQRATEVTDEASCARAAEILVTVKGAKKAIDKARLKAGEPYRQSSTAINNTFKELENPLDGPIERLTEEVKAFEKARHEEEEAQRKAYEKQQEDQRQREVDAKAKADAEASAAAAENRPAVAPTPPPPPVEPMLPPPPPRESTVRHTSSGSLNTRFEKAIEIFDEAMVPRKYRPIDESLILKDAQAGVTDIPGVRIYDDLNLASRTRKAT